MCQEVVAVGVEQRGFDVVVQIFELEVITPLDKAKVEVGGCLDDIAIGDREIADGVLVLGEFKDVCTTSTTSVWRAAPGCQGSVARAPAG